VDLKLSDNVAIVTGGSRGLGRAICLTLAREGARVAVNYRSNAAAADAVVAEIAERFDRQAVAVQADVCRSDDVGKLFDHAEHQLGPVDVLVNNAGSWPTAYVKDMTDQQWEDALRINLTGPFFTCREAVRRWLDKGRTGRIVNVSSQAAFHGSTTGHAHYAAAKAGLVNFTVSLAREMAPHDIHVNALAPGMMRTDMAREALDDGLQQYIERTPLGRIGDPGEMAAVVAFLASAQASYMTGATVDVSGGMLMR